MHRFSYQDVSVSLMVPSSANVDRPA
jgi:hypothetical protein